MSTLPPFTFFKLSFRSFTLPIFLWLVSPKLVDPPNLCWLMPKKVQHWSEMPSNHLSLIQLAKVKGRIPTNFCTGWGWVVGTFIPYTSPTKSRVSKKNAEIYEVHMEVFICFWWFYDSMLWLLEIWCVANNDLYWTMSKICFTTSWRCIKWCFLWNVWWCTTSSQIPTISIAAPRYRVQAAGTASAFASKLQSFCNRVMV